MGTAVKKFRDGSYLEYDQGKFDEWCVYLVDKNGERNPPRDLDYFSELQALSAKYGFVNLYNDYVKIYDLTSKEIKENVLTEIEKIAANYFSDAQSIERIFSILYMGMIAEEKKKYTKLGKRIKRLGMHKLLIEKKDAREAADFMRGMNWREIDALCKERGF